MNKEFSVLIYTIDKAVIEEKVVSLLSESSEGKFEILKDFNSSIIGTVATTIILKKADDTTTKFIASPGLIIVKNNVVKFCCDHIDLI